MTYRISLLAFDRCLASGVVGPADLFYAANVVAQKLRPEGGPLFSVQVLSYDGRAVRAASGCRLDADGAIERAAPAHVVLVPGISVVEPDELIAAVERCGAWAGWLREQYRRGAWLAASCSGTFVLAQAGLLDGRPATTTNWFAELFRQRYPRVRLDADAAIVKTERIVTGGAALSYVDLVLYLLEIFAGRELARACARYVVMDNRRGAQAPELIRHHAQTYDPLVTKAERWMRAHLRSAIRVNDVATHVAVSARTLIRRFKQYTGESPQSYLQKLRLEAGKALLANTNYRVQQILERVGYNDESAFRRLFKKHTNLSPREYRRRFGLKPST